MRNKVGACIFLVPLIISTISVGTIMACPTCIGSIEHNSPKFFSNEAYVSEHRIQESYLEPVHASALAQEEEK